MSAASQSAPPRRNGEIGGLVARLRRARWRHLFVRECLRLELLTLTATGALLLALPPVERSAWLLGCGIASGAAVLMAAFRVTRHLPAPVRFAMLADELLGLRDRLTTGLELEALAANGGASPGATAALDEIRYNLRARLPMRLPRPGTGLPFWAPLIPATLALLGLFRPIEADRHSPDGAAPRLSPQVAGAIADRLTELGDEAVKLSLGDDAPEAMRCLAKSLEAAVREAAGVLRAEPDLPQALALLSQLSNHAAAASEANSAGDESKEEPGSDALKAKSLNAGSDMAKSEPEKPAGESAAAGQNTGPHQRSNGFSPEEMRALSQLLREDRESPSGGGGHGNEGTQSGGDKKAGQQRPDGERHDAENLVRAFREDAESLKEAARSGTMPKGGGALDFLVRMKQAAAQAQRLAGERAENPDEEPFGAPSDDPTPGGPDVTGARKPGAPDEPPAARDSLSGREDSHGRTLSALLRDAPRDESAKRELMRLLVETHRAEAGAVDRETSPPGERRWIRRYFELIAPE